jgi:hypothetical protein
MKLLDQVRQVARVKHFSYRTEQAYAYWIERYIRFHGIRKQWAVGSGQWAVGSGQWAVGNGQWAVGSGQ